MAWFKRKKADQAVLPEIERYYDAEKRERIGLAWLLAVISIACVALLLMGAFFGGRWVYRKASHTDKTAGIVATVTSEAEIGKSKNTSSGSSDTNKAPATAPTPSTPVPKNSSNKPQSEPTPTAKTPAPAPATPTTPTVATNSTKLVNTGPANTIAVFIVSVLGFAGLHNLLSRRAAREN